MQELHRAASGHTLCGTCAPEWRAGVALQLRPSDMWLAKHFDLPLTRHRTARLLTSGRRSGVPDTAAIMALRQEVVVRTAHVTVTCCHALATDQAHVLGKRLRCHLLP